MRWFIYLFSGVLMSFNAFAVEEAKYEVVEEDGVFEIRDYESHILAEIVISNSMEQAGNDAFRPLFKYISGANKMATRIEMTAPVSQEKVSKKIPMTAPVSQEKSDQGWVVSFMMPATNTLETLPRPDNDKIKLRVVPARRMASVRYSGTWKEKRYNKFLKKLQAWIKEKELEVTGEPIWARYNPPFQLWFLRRNEILIPINKKINKDS